MRSLNLHANRTSPQEQIITSNGLIECSLQAQEEVLTNVIPSPEGFPLYSALRTFGYLLAMDGAFRVRFGRPDMEFALDFEWRVPDGAHFPMDRRDRDRETAP